LLLSTGVHPKVVQERLGHSQISVTLDVYSHVLPTLQLEAADKLDSILRGGAAWPVILPSKKAAPSSLIQPRPASHNAQSSPTVVHVTVCCGLLLLLARSFNSLNVRARAKLRHHGPNRPKVW
jgi:hypothetical protein